MAFRDGISNERNPFPSPLNIVSEASQEASNLPIKERPIDDASPSQTIHFPFLQMLCNGCLAVENRRHGFLNLGIGGVGSKLARDKTLHAGLDGRVDAPQMLVNDREWGEINHGILSFEGLDQVVFRKGPVHRDDMNIGRESRLGALATQHAHVKRGMLAYGLEHRRSQISAGLQTLELESGKNCRGAYANDENFFDFRHLDTVCCMQK